MFEIKKPVNEPVRQYAPGTAEREDLKIYLDRIARSKVEIPCVIGGKEVWTREKRSIVMPHHHQHILGHYCWASPNEMKEAVDAAAKAKKDWAGMAWQDRVAIFLKAADLLAGPYRPLINAATMQGQSKNAYQSEVDAACELIDFLRFNAYFYSEILKEQPISPGGMWNRVEYRELEGFVLAITPFNFTAIAANLPTGPAMLGNTVVWKPSDTQMLSAHYTMKLLEEAGLPKGVINLVAADGPVAGQVLVPMKDLAGIHFTGSTKTFQSLWKTIGDNISNYRSYPRLVGETGGKGFIFAHASSDIDALVVALIRGSFEYQGQKCSASSRAYIPKSIWKKVEEKLVATVKTLKMGDVSDFTNFVNAVIDERSFNKISSYLEYAKNSPGIEIIAGGKANREKGYFIEPTIVVTQDPKDKMIVEEIFGPILAIYVYEDSQFEEAVRVCDEATPYGLTGAIFAQDRAVVHELMVKLRHSAGNFYVNDKPTAAVVGQQPFGGARASGTNDKAGSSLNLYRWLSARTLKETFVPAKDHRYPFMASS